MGEVERASADWSRLPREGRDHEELRGRLRVVRGLPRAMADPAVLRLEVPRLRRFLKRALPDRFRHEEQVLFLRVLEAAPEGKRPMIARAVLDAQREHELILAQSGAVLDALAGLPRPPRPADLDGLDSLLGGLCDALLRNADKEEWYIFP